MAAHEQIYQNEVDANEYMVSKQTDLTNYIIRFRSWFWKIGLLISLSKIINMYVRTYQKPCFAYWK